MGPHPGLKAPVTNLGKDRQASIINGTPARFDIADNPDADGREPSYAAHSVGFVQVDLLRYVIEAEARKQGVDPDLVKAIMYVENAQGNYFGLARVAEGLGLAKSLFPMNIRPSIWHQLGYTEEQFKDPRLNIRAAITLLKRIIERIENPTVAKIATLWNSLPKEKVSDFGARVAEVYKARSWEKP